MNKPEFFVCDAVVGRPRVPAGGSRPDVRDLKSDMERLQIETALVRHRACIDNATWFGNDVLLEEIADEPSLIPVWAVTPDGRPPDFDLHATIGHMLECGVKVAWLAPTLGGFSAHAWCCGDLYAALREARMPVLLDFDEVTADNLHDILTQFPGLRVILLNVPRVGRNRLLYPLLRQHESLFVCFGPPFSAFGIYGDLCRQFGPERWVLGTGYPHAEGGAGIAGLMYAGLSESEVAAVASGNMRRLLAEVRTS